MCIYVELKYVMTIHFTEMDQVEFLKVLSGPEFW